MQKNAACFVCNDYKLTTSTTGLVKSLGWDILQHRRLFNQSVLFINSVMVLLIASFLSQLLFPAKSGLLHATRILISNLKQNDVSAFPFFSRSTRMGTCSQTVWYPWTHEAPLSSSLCLPLGALSTPQAVNADQSPSSTRELIHFWEYLF